MRASALLLLSVLSSSVIAAAASAKIKSLPNGVQATASGTTVQITALRDDVLRVRIGQDGKLPEDASWAVLPASRTSSIHVSPDATGFHTASLQVTLDPTLRLTVSDLAGHILQQDSEPILWHGTGFRVTKQKDPADHFFGLGDKPGPLDRAGQSFTMWNTDAFGWQESTDPIYKSIPFFIDLRAGRALGVLFDNTWRTSFDFGKDAPGQYTFSAPNGPVDYYLLYGPTPKQVVETYAWLTGPTPLPPLWTLGFQQSRYSYVPESKVIEIADRLRADHIPSDAIYLDIDYQKSNRPFTVDTDKFPHFQQMIQDLAQKNFHIVAITDLHIAHLPNAGYTPYDTGTAGDHFVKNPDGTTYVGPVWPGPSVFPDFTRKASRDWWGTLYQDFTRQGVAGFWNDMNEPAVFTYPTKTMPDNIQHRIDEPGFQTRTTSHLEVHNIYGLENSRGTYEGLLSLQPDQRPFVLTRASYAGGQRYAATWTGDNSSTWNHLRMSVPQIVNLGLSGFAMTGADVGGFAGSPSPDLLTKWLELAAFQPIDRDHAAKGTRDHEPWVDGPEHLAIRRRYIEERYRLMPYLYTVAEEMSRTGLPIMRPLFLEFPQATNDGHPIDLDAGSEFLFGPSLLIAPNPSPEEVAPYEVHLPPGVWYDYWTGARLDRRALTAARDLEQRDAKQPNKPLLVTPTLADLPVYVREGTILPISPLTQSTNEVPNGPLTLRVYPGQHCSGDLYQDDGKSFAFRTGSYLRIHLSCTENPDGSLALHIDAPQGSFAPWWKQIRIEAYGWTPTSRTATTPQGAQPLQQSGAAWTLTIPAVTTATELVLR
ncbi:TIM-barrel domain-containing protein [Granulicella sp. dw_53]|uniref:glycoside hydrolase family 31 protein n=1 Tax=Granulicella sp. dw_53 TaxID=2719792 RepID=UPI001BD2FDDB|nr:TIM-barrel domain-containing protein [Granulicella sp. dw_53]